VDGVRVSAGSSASTTVTAGYPFQFGVLCDQSYGFYEGEIAAARIYQRALTHDEMREICEYYADKYGFMSRGQLPETAATVKAIGVGATNITVAAGATLRFPAAATTPYTVKAGTTLAGAGTVTGSVRYGTGSELVVTAERPAIEDLQIDGATLVFTRDQPANAPADGSNVSRLTGTVTLDLTDWAQVDPLPGHIKLMRLNPAAVDATFVLKGLSDKSRVVFHEDTGLLEVRTQTGCVVIVR